MQIIALTGKSNAGKDTFASFLSFYLKQEKKTVAITSFSKALYKSCSYMFPGFLSKQYYDSNVEQKYQPLSCGKSPKQLLVEVGQKIKEIYPTVWIDSVLSNCYFKNYDFLIITDLRFPDELTALSEKDAFIIEIIRPDKGIDYKVDDLLTEYFAPNKIIENTNSLESLELKAKLLVYNKLLKKEFL